MQFLSPSWTAIFRCVSFQVMSMFCVMFIVRYVEIVICAICVQIESRDFRQEHFDCHAPCSLSNGLFYIFDFFSVFAIFPIWFLQHSTKEKLNIAGVVCTKCVYNESELNSKVSHCNRWVFVSFKFSLKRLIVTRQKQSSWMFFWWLDTRRLASNMVICSIKYVREENTLENRLHERWRL